LEQHPLNEVDIVLDYGQKLIPLEIKLSQTMNAHFLKGINYYKHISKQPEIPLFLLYGGNNSYQENGTFIYGFHDLAKLYQQLENNS